MEDRLNSWQSYRQTWMNDPVYGRIYFHWGKTEDRIGKRRKVKSNNPPPETGATFVPPPPDASAQLIPSPPAEEIYRTVFQIRDANRPIPHFDLEVVKLGETVSLDEPELVAFIVGLYNVVSNLKKKKFLDFYDLAIPATDILSGWKREGHTLEYCEAAIVYAFQNGLLIQGQNFKVHGPTKDGRAVLKQFVVKAPAVILPLLPTEEDVWPWKRDTMPLKELSKHLKSVFRVSERTVRDWSLKRKWAANVPQKDDKSKMVARDNVVKTLKSKGKI